MSPCTAAATTQKAMTSVQGPQHDPVRLRAIVGASNDRGAQRGRGGRGLKIPPRRRRAVASLEPAPRGPRRGFRRIADANKRGNLPANLATVAWCTAMVLAIDRSALA